MDPNRGTYSKGQPEMISEKEVKQVAEEWWWWWKQRKEEEEEKLRR